jgi:hypothetical protein
LLAPDAVESQPVERGADYGRGGSLDHPIILQIAFKLAPIRVLLVAALVGVVWPRRD